MRAITTSLLLACVAITAVSTEASAQRRRAYVEADASSINSLPLTVNRRSWLDPGTAAPAGQTGPAYVSATTGFARTQDQQFSDKFGNSVFRNSPYIPARNTPVVDFSTTPNGRVIVDNVYHYQPY